MVCLAHIFISLSMFAHRSRTDLDGCMMLPPRSNDSVGINFVRRVVVHQMNSDLDGLIWSRFELAQALISLMQFKTSDFMAADALG